MNHQLYEHNQLIPLREIDREIEELWSEFGDIPMNPETECIEDRFLHFDVGTERMEIWKWFDERYSNGVAGLLYCDGMDRTPIVSKLLYLHELCFECDSGGCCFNCGGECRFPMVHERKPRITDTDGCIDFDYSEMG